LNQRECVVRSIIATVTYRLLKGYQQKKISNHARAGFVVGSQIDRLKLQIRTFARMPRRPVISVAVAETLQDHEIALKFSSNAMLTQRGCAVETVQR